MTPKYCESCGREISPFHPGGKKRSSKAWAKVRFCCFACSKVPAPKIHKNCVICGKDFIPQCNNPEQKCCSRKCGARYSVQKGKEKPHRVAYDDGRRKHPICDCGEPATVKVYFYTIAATGRFTSQAHDVCASCRDYMLEIDPGCSATPLPLRDDYCYGFKPYLGFE